MILIADSGSTQTDWALCSLTEKSVLCKVKTEGINPIIQSISVIQKIIEAQLLPHFSFQSVTHLYFYGAGCTNEKASFIQQLLQTYFVQASYIEVNSDIMGAARSLFGTQPGIACILGTGSNSCFYDGRNIVNQIPSLGYILGDEGSGAYLGKRLLSDFLKNLLPSSLSREFQSEYQLSQSQILDSVYSQLNPNRFLASFTPFLTKHLSHSYVQELLISSFKAFFVRNIKQYESLSPIGFIGSIAFYFQKELTIAAIQEGLQITQIISEPIEKLITYHQEKF